MPKKNKSVGKSESPYGEKLYCSYCGLRLIAGVSPAEKWGSFGFYPYDAYDEKTGHAMFIRTMTCPSHSNSEFLSLFTDCDKHSHFSVGEPYPRQF